MGYEIETKINDLIARMYEIEGGYEFEDEEKDVIRFKDLQRPEVFKTFKDWDEVEKFVDENQESC